MIDFGPLLARAGIVLRPAAQGQAWAGTIRIQAVAGGLRMTAAAPFGTPIFETGADRDDVLTAIDGQKLSSQGDLTKAIQARKPGDTVRVTYERRGQPASGTMRLVADPTVEALPAEAAGQAVSAAQRAFREAWLSSAGTRLERQAAP
jgi:predicted metalloprotease with PDZ domain